MARGAFWNRIKDMKGKHIILTKKYCVYRDSTTESLPRVFYLGKGTESRVNGSHAKLRNELHVNISKKYGIIREVVFETDDASEAYLKEVELIAFHKTYVGPSHDKGNWGANLDRGGMGGIGTPKAHEHIEKIRAALKGKCKTQAHKDAMSVGGKGKKLTAHHRKNIGIAGKLSYSRDPSQRVNRQKGANKTNESRWAVHRFRKTAHAWFTRSALQKSH